jgi:pimeloyl-ACP methyl ester carboxylesterase
MTIQPEFATVQTNGIRLRVALAGKGPLVVLVHGWPESWYSWRHQIPALVEAGYRVAAPDVRGYGGSDKPAAIEAYAIKEMCADIAGLVEGLGERQAILIGHDWGAPMVWHTSLFFPQRVRAVAALSVPHAGRGPAHRIELFRNIYKDRFFYQLYFQQPGVAEAEFETDVRASLRKIYYSASGEGRKAAPRPAKPADAKYLDGLVDPNPLPDWLTPDDSTITPGNSQAVAFADRSTVTARPRSTSPSRRRSRIAGSSNRRPLSPAALIRFSASSRGSIWSSGCASTSPICGSFELSMAPVIGCSRSVPPK